MPVRHVAMTVFLMFGTAAYAQDYTTAEYCDPWCSQSYGRDCNYHKFQQCMDNKLRNHQYLATPIHSCICAAGHPPRKSGRVRRRPSLVKASDHSLSAPARGLVQSWYAPIDGVSRPSFQQLEIVSSLPSQHRGLEPSPEFLKLGRIDVADCRKRRTQTILISRCLKPEAAAPIFACWFVPGP